MAEPTLWDLLLDLFGLIPIPETTSADEFGGVWMPGG